MKKSTLDSLLPPDRTDQGRHQETHCMDRHPADLMTMDRLPMGVGGVVDSVQGPLDLKRRLLELGFCNRAKVVAVRRAPLGEPVEYAIRGYSISLRQVEARCVRVSADPAGHSLEPARGTRALPAR